MYNVAKASKTYKELYNTNGTGVISYIYKAISDKSGNIQYENIENDGSRMSIGNVYWIYCTKDVLMPFLPTED